MLNIGDFAQHQITGLVGQVIGYGHEVLHGVYLTTLKVRESYTQESPNRGKFVEDVYSAWMPAEVTKTSKL